MAWWHNDDGTEAKPFKGKFDPSHAFALIPFLFYLAYVIYERIAGR